MSDSMDFTQPSRVLPLLDIGGEGRYPEAWNLNPRPTRTIGPATGSPIPNWIAGRADAIPLPDSSVTRIVVERTPLNNEAYGEITRIAVSEGQIVLRHVRPPWSDPHRRATRHWGPPIRQRLTTLAGRIVQESEFICQ